MIETKKQHTRNARIIFYSQYIGVSLFRWYLKCTGGYKVEFAIRPDAAKTYLFIANHQSRVDPFATFAALAQKSTVKTLPIRFMTARAIYYSFLYPFLKLLGCFPTRKKGVDVIARSTGYLRQGQCLYIFPEGRRVLRSESNPRPGIEKILAAVPQTVQPVLVHLEWELLGGIKRRFHVSFQEVALAEIKNKSAKDIMDMVYKV